MRAKGHKNKKERGVALLFTLGILAVLLVVAMGFATTAITERKAASNNADLTFARLLAESGVQRSLAALKYYQLSVPTAAYDKMFSHLETDAVAANNATFDFLWRLQTEVNGVKYYEWDKANYDNTKDEAVHWLYVKEVPTDVNSKILGRFAYYVKASGGKLDPAACVKQTVDAGGALDESTVIDTTTPRCGAYPYEISLNNINTDYSGTYLTPAFIQAMSSTAVASGKLLDPPGRWTDLDTMCSPAKLNVTDAQQKEKYNDWFTFPTTKDNEAFWIDDTYNGLQELGELYYRFNLARTDWNALPLPPPVVDNVLAAKTPFAAGGGGIDLDGDLDTSDHAGSGIKWLTDAFKDTTGADDQAFKDTFADVTKKRKQIAANLIDYCDTNSTTTTDGTPGMNYADSTYTGNEKCPYINEIRMQIEGTVSEDPPSNALPGFSNYTCTFRMKTLDVELVDIYGVAMGVTADVLCTITADWAPGATALSISNPSVSVATSGAKGYFSNNPLLFVPVGPLPATVPDLAALQARSITNLKVTGLKVKLSTGLDFYDFSNICADSGAFVLSADGTTGTYYLDWQVDDPRQNLNEGDWSVVAASNAGPNGTITTAPAIGKNSTCNPNPGGDKDPEPTATEPWLVSTAYIRDAAMQSPWELGFIHRAAKWETINLKKYNDDDDNSGTGGEQTATKHEYGVQGFLGMRAYAKGDANILDQIKMIYDTQCFGKVNVRAAQIDSLKALLGYIHTGATLPTFTGTVLDYPTDVKNMASAINGSSILLTRGMLAKVSKLSDGTEISQTTDATKEEIIGKFINLTKTEIADEFTVIVLAQSIRDVGGPGGTAITINKDLNRDGDVSDDTSDTVVRSTVGYYYDADGNGIDDSDSASSFTAVSEGNNNCKLGQYDVGFDEIVAEQKVMVTVKRNATTGKWEIVKYEYVED